MGVKKQFALLSSLNILLKICLPVRFVEQCLPSIRSLREKGRFRLPVLALAVISLMIRALPL
jgi:hypothetical protein